MIIAAARCTSSAGDNGTGEHVFNGPANEAIHVIQGCRQDIHDMVSDARGAGAKYAYRHVKISAFEDTTTEQGIAAAKLCCKEYKVDFERCILVEHQKDRQDVAGEEKACGRHWHLIMPEYDVVFGRVTDSSFFKRRNEKLGRLIESIFGHAHVSGKANRLVVATLEKDADLAEIEHRFDDAVSYRAAAISMVSLVAERDFSPTAAYTFGQHQSAARHGWSMPEAVSAVKSAWNTSDSGSAMCAALAETGIRLRLGDKGKTPKIIAEIMVGDDWTFVSSVDRIVGVKAAEAAARFKGVDFAAAAEAAPPQPVIDVGEGAAQGAEGHAGKE